jgi:biotin/methionine sulfoxide reductase
LRRLLNLFGGHVFHKNSYSLAAAGVILPHVVGEMQQILGQHTPWTTIEAHGRLVVAFGGLALKNAQVNAGGVGRHTAAEALRACRAAGIAFVNVSPLRDDMPDWLDAQWLPVVPNSDTALMLALAHTLVAEGLHDRAFLARYCVGFERFERYLRGADDGPAEIRTVGGTALRHHRRHDHGAGAAHGGRTDPHLGELVAAARGPWRAAVLGGDRAGGHAGSDRLGGRRHRFRLQRRPRHRQRCRRFLL